MSKAQDDYRSAMDESTERAVERFNRIINEPLPIARITMANQLAAELGKLLVVPVILIEQLIAKLDQEAMDRKKLLASGTVPPGIPAELIKVLARATEINELKDVGTLKAFLQVRPMIITAVKAFTTMTIDEEGYMSPVEPEKVSVVTPWTMEEKFEEDKSSMELWDLLLYGKVVIKSIENKFQAEYMVTVLNQVWPKP